MWYMRSFFIVHSFYSSYYDVSLNRHIWTQLSRTILVTIYMQLSHLTTGRSRNNETPLKLESISVEFPPGFDQAPFACIELVCLLLPDLDNRFGYFVLSVDLLPRISVDGAKSLGHERVVGEGTPRVRVHLLLRLRRHRRGGGPYHPCWRSRRRARTSQPGQWWITRGDGRVLALPKILIWVELVQYSSSSTY